MVVGRVFCEEGQHWVSPSDLLSGVDSCAECWMVNGGAEERRCRSCGCTDDNCAVCVEETGEPCWWVEEDLCSRCAR